MGAMQPWHWLIVILVFVLLFGAKKLPEMARSVGQSARVFKSEMKGMQADDEVRKTSQPPALPAPDATQPQAAQPRAQSADGSTSSDTSR